MKASFFSNCSAYFFHNSFSTISRMLRKLTIFFLFLLSFELAEADEGKWFAKRSTIVNSGYRGKCAPGVTLI